MWPFTKARSPIPDGCDFQMARAELADFFRIANEDAAKKGARVAYKQEFVARWERFAANPCKETAAAWLTEAKDYESLLMTYFTECSPGGRFHTHRDLQKVAKERPEGFSVIDSAVKTFAVDKPASEAFRAAILSAAYQCRKATEQYIKADDDKDRLNKVFLINCEFFYFFMHLANRRFYTDHGEAIGSRWQSDLGPTYVTAFLESVIGRWPQEMRGRMRSELYEKMNDAERDYTECRGFYPEDNKIISGNTLFVKLARNVAELAGATNPVDQFSIRDSAFHVFLRMDFQDRVKAVASELR